MPNAGYQEIARRLRESIERSGEGWEAGAALPSEAQLAGKWAVTRTTVRRALGVLEADGLIEVVPGRGRFVRSSTGTRQPSALFEEVAAALRDEIATGTTSAGLLGTEASIARRFGVSLGTVRQALKELVTEGLVIPVHGRGWFVASPDMPLTRTDEVVQRMRGEIRSGPLSKATTLPGEALLAQRYGVARGTIRRALAQLENEGLVRRMSGRGRVIAEPDRSPEN